MVGIWPNCYYPQYLQLNQSLANSTNAAHVSIYRAVLDRTITPALWANLISLRSQLTAHLSLAQTQINDCLRIQGIAPYLYNRATPAQVAYAQNTATQNGLDPNFAAQLVYYGTHLANNPNLPTLESRIMQLPNTGALDNLAAFADQTTSNITIASNGVCQYLGDPAGLTQIGAAFTNAGTLAMSLSVLVGPAAPELALVGAAFTISGIVIGEIATMCEE